jgi:hypothetical protein
MDKKISDKHVVRMVKTKHTRDESMTEDKEANTDKSTSRMKDE